MSDFLIDLGANPQARKIIKSLGLPLPLPQKLRRLAGPWDERPLHNACVVVRGGPRAALADTLAEILAAAGANPFVAGDEEAAQPYRAPGEAHGRPATVVGLEPPRDIKRVDAIIYDATGLEHPDELRDLYAFCHPWVRKLAKCGRIVVLARPGNLQNTGPSAATQAALGGFARSIAKEVGKKGATAQFVRVDAGAEDRLAGVLRFILSPRSAYVSGQPFDVTATAQAPAAIPWTRVLDGKVALVTGAARGIGAATAKLLAAEGAHVVCLDRPEDDGPVSRIARQVGGSPLLVDVSSADAAEVIVKDLEAQGGVDVVVHNAGITRDKTLARMKQEQWDQVIAINLQAILDITDAVLAGPMKDEGRIILLTSIAGIAGNMGQTNYAASKAGLIGLVEQLAPAVAHRGITVNAVAPGFIETRLTAAIPIPIREAGRRLNNLSQGGLPQDVGELISFLASPGAAGMTGTVARVCGGSLLGA